MFKFLLKSALLVGAAGLVLEGLKTLEEEQEKNKEFHIPKTPSRPEEKSEAAKTVSALNIPETKEIPSGQEIKDLALIQDSKEDKEKKPFDQEEMSTESPKEA